MLSPCFLLCKIHSQELIVLTLLFYFRMELNFRSPEFTIQSMKLPKVASVAMMYMISIVDSISLCFQIPVPVWVPKLRRFSAAVFWCHLSCMCSSCFVRKKAWKSTISKSFSKKIETKERDFFVCVVCMYVSNMMRGSVWM